MLMTVTNTSASAINGAQTQLTLPTSVVDSLSGLSFVGGQKTVPLPYPFDRTGEIAASGTRALPVHYADFASRRHVSAPLAPAQEWAQLVQAKTVSVAFALLAYETDPADLAITELGS